MKKKLSREQRTQALRRVIVENPTKRDSDLAEMLGQVYPGEKFKDSEVTKERESIEENRRKREEADAKVDVSKLKESAFTYLVMQLNAMLDSGKFDNITIQEVNDHIDARDVLRWLAKIGDGVADFSLYLSSDIRAYGDFETLYSNWLENVAGGYRGDEGRKWGVRKRGLCLLIAWTNEVFQTGGSGWTPTKDMFRTP
jgi:hypothetical protein